MEANRKSAEITRIPQEKILGRPILDLMEIPKNLAKELFAKIEKKQSYTFEASLSCNTANKIPLEVHASVITLEGIQYLQWIFHDISERKKLDLLRDDLSAMIYHDLRSPLAALKLQLQSLRRAGDDASRRVAEERLAAGI